MKLMYMATDEHADWVACPAIDLPRSQERWQASGVFANGGGWVRRSAAGHRVYDMSWNLMSADSIARVRAFFDGVYGNGPFYFVDPAAERTNVFPAAWASPRLGLEGGPTLVYDQTPSREQFPGPNRTYPQVGARYVLDSSSSVNTLKVPVPDGHRFHFRAGYNNPQSSQVESARQALLDALAAYTDAPVAWSTTAPGDTSVVWVDPATGVGRVWSANRRVEDVAGEPSVSVTEDERGTVSPTPTSAVFVGAADPEWDSSVVALQTLPATVLNCYLTSAGVGLASGGHYVGLDGLHAWYTLDLSDQETSGLRVGTGSSQLWTEPFRAVGYDHALTEQEALRVADILAGYLDPHWATITDPAVVAAGQAYADAVTNAEGSTELSYRNNAGPWEPLRSTTHSVTGPGWVEFSLQGTGPVNVFWAQGIILPAHEPVPQFKDFHPGQGNSGVDFEDFQEHTHSVGLDRHGASVRLREVVAWL